MNLLTFKMPNDRYTDDLEFKQQTCQEREREGAKVNRGINGETNVSYQEIILVKYNN